MTTTQKTIGNLNGWWAFGLKFTIVSVPTLAPFFIGWAVWVTSETYANREFRNTGTRFTQADSLDLKAEVKESHDIDIKRIESTIYSLPPQDWRDRIQRMEVTLDTIKANQTRILTIIEKLP